MPCLFSYGTLQREDVQLALFGRPLRSCPDTLRGYQLADVEINDPVFLARGENTIQRTLLFTGNESDEVEGQRLEVTEEELHHADRYEPANYRREKVGLASGNEVWIYTV